MRYLAAMVVALSLPAHAATPVIDARRADVAPVIDGRIDDACWKDAKPAGGFLVMNTDTPATWTSEVRFCFDDANLYIAVRCNEPDVSNIDTKAFERDHHDVFRTDHVEIMLDPGQTSNEYFHIGVNASGSVSDRACTQGGHIGDFSWDANITSASHIGDNDWSCELAIPFYSLGVTADVGSTWRVNVCRHKQKPKELSSISEKGAFNIAGSFVELRGVDADFNRYSYVIGEPKMSTLVKGGALELSLGVDVRNDTGQTAPVLLDAWLISPGDNVFAAKQVIEPAPGDESAYTLGPMTLTEQGEYVCHVRVADALTKKTLAVRKTTLPITYVPVAIKLVEPWYRNAIFSTQSIDKMQLDLDVRMEEAALKSMSADVRIEDLSGKALSSLTVSPLAVSQRLSYDAASLPEAKMRIVAVLRDAAGKTVADTSHPLRKLAYKKGEVWLGKDMQWRIEGKPFFLNGAWNAAKDRVRDYNAMTGNPEGDILWIAHDIMNILWYKVKSLRSDALSDEDVEKVTAYARETRDHPKLFAYFTSDEPEVSNIKPAVLERVYDILADEDPYHPVIISNDSMHGLHAYATAADINGLHPYPAILKDKRVNDLTKVAVFVDGTAKFFAGNAHKQTVAYLHQGFNYGDYGAVNQRIPSYVEYRSQDLLAIVCGANGLMHFNRMVAHYPELHIGMVHLAKECAYLGPRIIAPTASIEPTASSDKIKMLLKDYNGEMVLFACNADDEPRDVTITVPGADRWHVISEDRTVAGSFTDRFDAWEVHIYSTNLTKPDLLTVKQINKLIDDANAKRRKPGNLAFQMFEGDGVVVSASTNYAGKYRRLDAGLWHVVDGIVDTYDHYKALTWHDTTDKESPDWLEIKLPKAHRVGRVVVYPFDKTLKDYSVQAHVGGQWKDMDQVTGQNRDRIEHKFSTVTTDRIRLFVTATNGPNARVTEMEIYEQ